MRSWVYVCQAACLALVVAVMLPGCEGSDDCSDSDAIGIWHMTKAETDTTGYNFFREDVIFRPTCVVEANDYEGAMNSRSGFYDDHGGELHLLFGGGNERTAEQDGETMTMVTDIMDQDHQWTLTLTRTSTSPDGPIPDPNPKKDCCHCICICGKDQLFPLDGDCGTQCQQHCKSLPGCEDVQDAKVTGC